jgi:hypothetical protein
MEMGAELGADRDEAQIERSIRTEDITPFLLGNSTASHFHDNGEANMSTQLKTLARSLQAAGYASQGENTTRLLVEVSNKLVERVWNGEQLGNQIFVCSNVRSKTPALYFVTPEAPPPPPADAETATVQHDSQPGLPSPKAKVSCDR